MMEWRDETQNVQIRAQEIRLGRNVSFGKNVKIDVRGIFALGDRSRIGDNAVIEGRNVMIGSDLWNSSREFGGLSIGRGRKNWPEANCIIGDRCTIHNNTIDLARPVTIGNDVGLSPDVTIYTHGYWLSVLEGYPAKYGPVTIGNGVIVGYRSLILMGVTIGDKAVIGAQSVVTNNLEGNAIYGGDPAKKLKDIAPPSETEKRFMTAKILKEYEAIVSYRGLWPVIALNYPIVTVNACTFNLETLEVAGDEDEETDDFRDFVFRFGLRFFTKRPFKNTYRDHQEGAF
ncbi:MAG: DapH/DapD/GlmU-related protein [bacterium]|nr:DapH/DapD/GlmU-related protein [bacterium]